MVGPSLFCRFECSECEALEVAHLEQEGIRSVNVENPHPPNRKSSVTRLAQDESRSDQAEQQEHEQLGSRGRTSSS
ncbi:hypothetical protein ECG_01944 [Echinococcus granulosus]|nr:hypothetical protein ECG_01944 [Echinococcus granulosus]